MCPIDFRDINSFQMLDTQSSSSVRPESPPSRDGNQNWSCFDEITDAFLATSVQILLVMYMHTNKSYHFQKSVGHKNKVEVCDQNRYITKPSCSLYSVTDPGMVLSDGQLQRCSLNDVDDKLSNLPTVLQHFTQTRPLEGAAHPVVFLGGQEGKTNTALAIQKAQLNFA